MSGAGQLPDCYGLGFCPPQSVNLAKLRRHLQHREGRVSIPYLYDPGPDVGMFESADILAHLRERYAG